MLNITAYTVDKLKDPFGILEGDRYELILDLDVPEDDELYMEQGLKIRILYISEETRSEIIKYDLMEKSTDEILDFELEDEELELISAFCKEHIAEAL